MLISRPLRASRTGVCLSDDKEARVVRSEVLPFFIFLIEIV